MSNREKLPEWIVRYNEQDLAGDELHSFLEMIERNPAIEREVRLDLALNEVLRDEELIDLQAKILQAVHPVVRMNGMGKKLLLFAAALLALLLLEVAVSRLCTRTLQSYDRSGGMADREVKTGPYANERQAQTPLPDDKGSKPRMNRQIQESKAPERSLLAEAFRPNPELEELVGISVRSGYFRLLSPVPLTLEKRSREIVVRWESDLEDELDLVVVDNRGEKVLEVNRIATDRYSFARDRLKSGLYYLKFLQGRELISMGKLVVE